MNPTDNPTQPNNLNTPMPPASVTPPQPPKSNKGLIIGSVAVVVVLIILAVAIAAMKLQHHGPAGVQNLPAATPATSSTPMSETPMPQASPVTINNPEELNAAYQQAQTINPSSLNNVVEQNNSYASQFSQ